MGFVLAVVRQLWFGSWCALLPAPERRRLAHVHEIDAPRWSLGLGLLQSLAGGVLFLVGGVEFLRPAAADQSMFLLRNWFPGLSTTHFQGVGLINWFAWFLYPASWPLAYMGLVGITRCIAFAATREAMGEPVVWAALRGWQGMRSSAKRRAFERRLGPRRPDRIESGDGELVVVTCREKTDWSPTTTIVIDDRYYELTGVEQRADGAWTALAYRLREQPPGRIIRRLLEYDRHTSG